MELEPCPGSCTSPACVPGSGSIITHLCAIWWLLTHYLRLKSSLSCCQIVSLTVVVLFGSSCSMFFFLLLFFWLTWICSAQMLPDIMGLQRYTCLQEKETCWERVKERKRREKESCPSACPERRHSNSSLVAVQCLLPVCKNICWTFILGFCFQAQILFISWQYSTYYC